MMEIIKKNELGKEIKFTFNKKSIEGTQGRKNIPVKYESVHIIFRSIDNSIEMNLSYGELNHLRKALTECFKELLDKNKKSKITPI